MNRKRANPKICTNSNGRALNSFSHGCAVPDLRRSARLPPAPRATSSTPSKRELLRLVIFRLSNKLRHTRRGAHCAPAFLCRICFFHNHCTLNKKPNPYSVRFGRGSDFVFGGNSLRGGIAPPPAPLRAGWGHRPTMRSQRSPKSSASSSRPVTLATRSPSPLIWP